MTRPGGPPLLRKIKFLCPSLSSSGLAPQQVPVYLTPERASELAIVSAQRREEPGLWEAAVACRCSASLKPHNVGKNRRPAHEGDADLISGRPPPNSRRWKAKSLADYRRCTFCEIDSFLTDRRVSRRRGLRDGFIFFSAIEPNPKTLTPLKRGPFFQGSFFRFCSRSSVCVYVFQLRVAIIELCKVSWNCRSILLSFINSSINKVENFKEKRTLYREY